MKTKTLERATWIKERISLLKNILDLQENKGGYNIAICIVTGSSVSRNISEKLPQDLRESLHATALLYAEQEIKQLQIEFNNL